MVNGLLKSKCDTNRTQSKNHHSTTNSMMQNNLTLAAASALNKGATLTIREARTKPTSPDRSLLLIHNSYNQPSKKTITSSTPGNMYLAANQREERKALNMISTIGKNEILHHHNHHSGAPTNMSSLSQNQRVAATIELPKQGNSAVTNAGGNSKRKNFKNMFYSPKNNRDAYTEPHSKLVSQVQTKEHSPARYSEHQTIQ